MDRKAAVKVLRWYLGLYKNWPALVTLKDKKKFLHDVLVFVVPHRPVGWPVLEAAKTATKKNREMDEKSLDDLIASLRANICQLVEAGIYRRAAMLPWRITPTIEWRESEKRFIKAQTSHGNEFYYSAVELLYDALAEYGHLIKTCQAPRAGKRGKRGNAATITQTCNDPFVAERPSGMYCSATCQNRVLARSRSKYA